MGQNNAFEQPGTCFVMKEVGYEVLSKLDDGQVTIRNLMTLEKRGVPVKTLRQQLWAGDLRFAQTGQKNMRKEVGHPLKTHYAFTDLGFCRKHFSMRPGYAISLLSRWWNSSQANVQKL